MPPERWHRRRSSHIQGPWHITASRPCLLHLLMLLSPSSIAPHPIGGRWMADDLAEGDSDIPTGVVTHGFGHHASHVWPLYVHPRYKDPRRSLRHGAAWLSGGTQLQRGPPDNG